MNIQSLQRRLGIAALSLLWLLLATLIIWAIPTPVAALPEEGKTARALSQDAANIALSLFHPVFVKNASGQFSTLYMQNLHTTRVTYQVTFLDDGGTIVATKSGTLGARQTLKIAAADIGELVDGSYHAIVTTTDTVESVVHTLDVNAEALALYRGIVASSAGQIHYFGPLYKSESTESGGHRSQLILVNAEAESVNVQTKFYALDGTLIGSSVQTIAPNSRITDTTTLLESLAGDFTGWARVEADGALAGLLITFGIDDGLLHQPALTHHDHAHLVQSNDEADAATALVVSDYLPRVLKGVDEGGGMRTTRLFFIDDSDGFNTTRLALQYFKPGEAIVNTPEFNLGWHEGAFVDLSTELAPDNVYSVRIFSSEPPIVSELTTYDAPSIYASASYGTQARTSLALPYLVRSADTNSAFSVQNLGVTTATAVISYTTLAGREIAYSHVTFSPGAALRFEQRLNPSLGDDFQGSAFISASQPVKVWVDEYMDTDGLRTNTPAPFYAQVAGPRLGMVNQGMTFTASTVPPVTPPVGYGWEATGPHRIRTFDNTITGTATITWTQPGEQVVTLTGSADVGENVTTYTVTLGALEIMLTANQSATLVYTNSLQSATTIVIPPGAMTTTRRLLYAPVLRVVTPDTSFSGYGFELQSPDANGHPTRLDFAQPVQVTIELEGGSRTLSRALELQRWEEQRWVRAETACSTASALAAALAEQQHTACIDQTGRYGLFVLKGMDRQVFIPILAR